ncbi:MAG: hypothetical protein AB3N23_14540 [Paracoccaceae bacterium]
MVAKRFLFALVALLLCVTSAQSQGISGSLPTGVETISYATGPQVGRLYFANRPAKRSAIFRTRDRVDFYAMCARDFRKTQALIDIRDHVESTPYISNDTFKVTASVALEFAQLLKITGLPAGFSSNGYFEVVATNVVRHRLTEEGEDVIAAKLGQNCRELVRQYRAGDGTVAVILETFRAERLEVRIVVDGKVSSSPFAKASAEVLKTRIFEDAVVGLDLGFDPLQEGLSLQLAQAEQ